MARKPSRRIKALRQQVDKSQRLSITEACEKLNDLSSAKFDETIDIAVRLGVNPRHADQMVRGAVVLPHGTGQSVRVAVFAKGDKAKEAEEAGADVVGDDDLVEKIQGDWLDFDKVVATPDMMGNVGRIGRVLGPRGLMPNPKTGTVTPDIEGAVNNAKAGQMRFRTDKNGIVHGGIGKVDFESDQIRGNLMAVLADLKKAKPAASKGVYFRKVTLSTTMGPGVTVDHADLDI